MNLEVEVEVKHTKKVDLLLCWSNAFPEQEVDNVENSISKLWKTGELSRFALQVSNRGSDELPRPKKSKWVYYLGTHALKLVEHQVDTLEALSHAHRGSKGHTR